MESGQIMSSVENLSIHLYKGKHLCNFKIHNLQLYRKM